MIPTSTPTAASTSKPAPRMTVPLLDLKMQYQSLKHELLPAVEAVLASQACINGPAVVELEKAIAQYAHAAACIGVSSGTDALVCALMALDIGAGDEVITSPYTFFATAGSIARLGAKPVFVDIDPVTFNLDTAKIPAALTPRTKAIMPVHLFGQTADMDPILALAKERGLHVIEDAAQAIGATCKGRPAGSMGTVGCFSFFPSKNLGAAGDGGAIVTQDAALAERMRILRNHGAKPKYYHQFIGGNFRLDTIQAAYLLVKLKHLDSWSQQRRRNAAIYDQLLVEVPQVTRPVIAAGNTSIYNQYVIRVPRRESLRQHLTEQGIGCEVYYPLSLHEQACFADLGYAAGAFPQSQRAAAESLALPIYPELTAEQMGYVVETIKGFYGAASRGAS
ncbi:MAG: DegT/DnrJ/EryC1/StrS family aminotransferase [Phycisphaeraceae bacterium]